MATVGTRHNKRSRHGCPASVADKDVVHCNWSEQAEFIGWIRDKVCCTTPEGQPCTHVADKEGVKHLSALHWSSVPLQLKTPFWATEEEANDVNVAPTALRGADTSSTSGGAGGDAQDGGAPVGGQKKKKARTGIPA